MNADTQAEFRKILIRMRDELDTETLRSEDSRKPVELDQQAIGRLSRMDALQNQAMAQASQNRRDGLVIRIRAALGRCEDGEFGYCVDCGEEIAPERLKIDPTIPKCISCANS